MHHIAAHLKRSTLTIISNIWLLTDSQGRRFLIDSGYPLERPQLWAQLWLAGIRRPGDLTAVLLTHRHSDHAGNAAWLQRRFQVPICCHHDDACVLNGQCARPQQARGTAPLYLEWLNHFEDRYPARVNIDEEYAPGVWKWGFSIIPVPGHTKGSVMLYHEPSQTLFSGDAILAGHPPFAIFENPMLAMGGFSDEVRQCHENVRNYLKVMPPIRFLAAGHGPAITENTFEKLKKLI